MNRAKVLQGIRLMNFETVLERWTPRELCQAEAGELLGIKIGVMTR